MRTYRIAVMEGDGIGPEIVDATVRVLDRAAQVAGFSLAFTHLPVGLRAFDKHGSTLPEETLAKVTDFEGWLLGPVTHHIYDSAKGTMPNPSGVLRKKFELYANVRPARSYRGVSAVADDVDLVIVRENTEGFYADRNVLDGSSEFRPTEDVVVSMRVVTRKASLRVAEQAFRLARDRQKEVGAGFTQAKVTQAKVTAVHKANVLRRGDGLFLDCCQEVAASYPEVVLDDVHADAFAMYLVKRPADFDVVVTTNLFGDILSDLAAALVGGLGLAPGLNVGDAHAMAQATHGSAPDIAGKGIANPVAEILSSALLLNWLGQRHGDEHLLEAARRIERAVERVFSSREALTPDLGGDASTNLITERILSSLET